MRAFTVTTPGGPEALKATDAREPIPGPGQVRIRVAAAAVNPVDAATRSGALTDAGLMAGFSTGRPVGIGWDVAGVVDAVEAHARLESNAPLRGRLVLIP